MSSPGEHLYQERLNDKANEVLKELKDLLKDLLEQQKFKMLRKNLYLCEDEPALFDIVKRLIKELDFIKTKVVHLPHHDYC